jgi:hypothetical protein
MISTCAASRSPTTAGRCPVKPVSLPKKLSSWRDDRVGLAGAAKRAFHELPLAPSPHFSQQGIPLVVVRA